MFAKQRLANVDTLSTLTPIIHFQGEHLEHLEIENLIQDLIMLNALRYNPAILATAADQIVLQASDIIHKVKTTIQEAQNNRLSTELLRGETVNKVVTLSKQVHDKRS